MGYNETAMQGSDSFLLSKFWILSALVSDKLLSLLGLRSAIHIFIVAGPVYLVFLVNIEIGQAY